MNGPGHATLVSLAPPPPVVRPAAKGTGRWCYRARRRSKLALWGAMTFSAALHALLLFGFNRKTPARRVVVVDDAIPVLLAMPELKDLEEAEREAWEGDEPPVDAGLTVPMLADVPSQVDLTNAFVQEIDYSSLVPQQDLTAAKTITIPPVINRGGRIGEGLGKIFDLKDLDRTPEPLVRIAPVVPHGLRQAGMTAEVMVGFIVDVNGAVVAPYIHSSTNRKVDDAALLAMSKWKFRPGVKNGRRVNVRMMQPLVFRVTED